ncbi:hypothetical protein BC936DRAFT_149048 [Jimgerdemannia flammicorona]|uniref:Uncharacterized protein n=2 Tax=Jimgerdemannia flammicorona TaxID=994334 RepID=A0A433QP74_9FUNG|nr:hypothetical protein BC936DRAFT_149048 [Jimgerdemannia flammicorona]RUS31557.1 hypothetical protein BC938DRAFT_477570 [Jimgerdemannia flammicorona]
MALREGAALHVLARDAHVLTLKEEGAPCECLPSRPVNVFALLDVLGALLDNLLQVFVHVEIVRVAGDHFTNGLQSLEGDAGRTDGNNFRGEFHGGLEA